MATQTSNLGLTKPAGTDFVQVNDFNGNSDIVDRSIGKLSELRTNVKSSLVEAINEAMISGGTDSPYINKTNGHWMQWNNTLLKFEDTGIVASGSMWYNGTKITGTSAIPSVFETGISLAHVGDLYLNIQSANVYWCAKEGNASTATWRYLCNIKGLTGDTGPIGPTGTTFTPSVNSRTGVISWSNDGGKTNPPSVSIKGPKGDPGVGLDIRGTYATLSDLQSAITSPQQGWMYNVGTAAPYRVYMYDSSAGWLDQGQLQGPAGSTGKSAYVAAVEGGYVGNEETFNVQMAEMPTHITNTNNPHKVNKSQIGLNKVDNTSDLEKPISKAQSAVNQQVATNLQDKQPLLTPGDNISITGRIITTKAFPCNPNLLDNWYFGKPVNQRGQTSYSTTTSGVGSYTIDRWRHGGYAQAIEVTGNGITWNTHTGVWWLQTIENWDALVGKTATVSALIGGNLYSVSGVVNNSDRISVAVSEKVSLEISPDERDVRLVSYVTEATSVSAVLAIKLELGSQQTLAHQENGVWVLNEIPKFGDQLAECQRYALVLRGAEQFYGGKVFNTDATKVDIFIPTPVTMRTTPVFSQIETPPVLQIITGHGVFSVTQLTVHDKTTNGVSLECSFGSGASTDELAFLRISGGKCLLSAEL